VTSAAIINEIKELPPAEQAEVIHFALSLAQKRQLTGAELGELADKLANSDDPGEILRLKSAMRRGYYGE
jgi:hypothetical protein